MDNDFLIAGTDEKMISCKNRLIQLGFNALCRDFEELKKEVKNYGRIILPLPTLANGCVAGVPFEKFCDVIKKEQIVYCGNIRPDLLPCTAYSYYGDEGFLIKNSRLTAQGTLRVVLENIRTDLYSLRVAVIGYGRCGREICRCFKNNGAKVTSFSRRMQSFAAAGNDGLQAEDIRKINTELCHFDIIINTVPYNIIEKKGLVCLTENNLYVEVASRPYGFNIAEADKYNFRYVLAESLPGRYTPVSAGVNIADTVAGMIREEKSHE